MFLHARSLREEISFYEEQNKRLAVEDLLREITGKKKIYKNKIKENEERMERVWFNNMCDIL